jgi:hypothetical protein
MVLALCVGLLAGYLGFTSSSGDERASARLAYVAGPGHVVWLAGADGRNGHALGPGENPLVGPNGEAIAAALPGPQGSALVIYSASGAPRRTYFDAGKVNAVPEAWSPDSRYLAVALSSSSPGTTSSAGLAIIDWQTGLMRRVANGQIAGASFAPAGPDRVVYGLSRSASLSARYDLWACAPDGIAKTRLTDDGRSLNPVWGPNAIAFDREHLRRRNTPVYEIWLIAPDGSAPRHLTHVPVRTLQDGLVPLAFSADGTRLLAEFQGLDTSQTWTIAVASPWVRQMTIAGESVTAGGLSRDGSSVLVVRGGYLVPPEQGTVEVLPFYGGRPTVLVARGVDPSWNR